MKQASLRKHEHKPIPNNKQGSLKRLENLGKKLQRELNLLAGYDSVIQDQLVTGIVERVTSEPVGGEFYIPYKGTRPNIGIGSHRCRSIGHRFFPIPLKVGPNFIGTK